MMAVVLAHVIAVASGACIEGTVSRCSLANCSVAYRTCVYPGFGPCECADEPTIQTVTVDGKYAIVGVWYAAPGPGSSTVYSNQSVTGTTVSTTTGGGTGISVGVSNGADFLGLAAGSVSLSYGQQWNTSSGTSTDSKLTYTTDNTIPGPGLDGIDHNSDDIVLLLKPEIKFTGSLLNGTLTDLKWAIDASRGVLYPVKVGWLNGTMPMPPNVLSDLGYWGGITAADFPQILGATPYAFDPEGLVPPAPERFECVEQLYYVPGHPNVIGYEVSNAYASTDTTSTSHSYTVTLALAGTFLGQKLNESNTWTWSNSSSTSNYSSSSSAFRLNLHQPSSAYTGSTILNVYVDKIYKTLMYSFVAPAIPNTYCW